MKNTDKLLEQILEQLHAIVEMMAYFVSEQEADQHAAQQIRFIGDGIDEEDNPDINGYHADNELHE